MALQVVEGLPRTPLQTILTVAVLQAARSLRKGAAGASKSHKGLLDRLRGFRVRTLGQLVQWGALMATCGLLLVLLLETTKSHSRVSDVHDYLKVCPSLRSTLRPSCAQSPHYWSQLRCMLSQTGS